MKAENESTTTSRRQFVTESDACYLHAGHPDPEPALQINPDATIGTLLAALHRRADMLHKSLDYWARSGTEEIAEPLETQANEVLLLVEAVESVHFKSIDAGASHG